MSGYVIMLVVSLVAAAVVAFLAYWFLLRKSNPNTDPSSSTTNAASSTTSGPGSSTTPAPPSGADCQHYALNRMVFPPGFHMPSIVDVEFGASEEGTICHLCSNPALGAVKLYRLYKPATGQRKPSLQFTEAGWSWEMDLGYVYPRQGPGMKPVYIKTNGTDFMISNAAAEGAPTWTTTATFYAF